MHAASNTRQFMVFVAKMSLVCWFFPACCNPPAGSVPQCTTRREYMSCFLQSQGLLLADDTLCEGRGMKLCGAKMRETTKKKRNGDIVPALRCTDPRCQTWKSFRSLNFFFHYEAARKACIAICLFRPLPSFCTACFISV